jgi:hypothetical protein
MSDEVLEFLPIPASFVPRALDRAEHYRLLNEPNETESICLDVLALEPDNQRALGILILAITDQFADGAVPVRRARQFLSQVTDEYQRLYLSGLVAEREARAFLRRELRGEFAYDSLRAAMDLFERARRVAPLDDHDAILRWNSCLRLIRRHNLESRKAESELPLE